jgi:hypothetical protein
MVKILYHIAATNEMLQADAKNLVSYKLLSQWTVRTQNEFRHLRLQKQAKERVLHKNQNDFALEGKWISFPDLVKLFSSKYNSFFESADQTRTPKRAKELLDLLILSMHICVTPSRKADLIGAIVMRESAWQQCRSDFMKFRKDLPGRSCVIFDDNMENILGFEIAFHKNS